MRTFWKRVMLITIAFATVSGTLRALMMRQSNQVVQRAIPYVLVLGAKVRRGAIPSEALANRLDVAAQYAKRYPESMVIVSGGRGPDEDEFEAVVMRRYLIAAGIEETRIVEERKATSTYENILFAKQLVPDMHDVLIISNDYHLLRAKILAKRQHLHVQTLAAPTPEAIQQKVRIREKIALIKAIVFGK
ncbi:YdcF family protein [Kurthia senegalensis]|uniref:YdcF family protein n=1 Tax=Kurthia senegalensis TaxID=1033740 RepID=UPI000289A4BB|nr:YdcF family protein [Kurthia senegalensis]